MKNKVKLTLKWSKRLKSLVCNYPDNGRADAALAFYAFTTKRCRPLNGIFDDSFVDELKSRGYDITTLKFSVEKLPEEQPKP